MFGGFTDWLASKQEACPNGWMVGESTDWLVGCKAGCLANWAVVSLVSWLPYWLASWIPLKLIGCLAVRQAWSMFFSYLAK